MKKHSIREKVDENKSSYHSEKPILKWDKPKSWENMLPLCFIIFLSLTLVNCGKNSGTVRFENLISVMEISENEETGILLGNPQKLVLDEQKNIWVLAGMMEAVYKFDKDGRLLEKVPLKIGNGPGEFHKFGICSFTVFENKIAIFDNLLKRVTILDDKGDYISSFRIDFNGLDIEYTKNNEFVILGKKEGMIFHKFNSDGEFLKSFGEQIDENPAIFPVKMAISGNSFYVCSPKGYDVYRYQEDSKELAFQGKRDIGYELVDGKGIVFPSAINGIVFHKDFLYVTTYGKEGEFQLDIFSSKKQRLIATIPLEAWGSLGAIDEDVHLYFLREGKIEKSTIN